MNQKKGPGLGAMAGVTAAMAALAILGFLSLVQKGEVDATVFGMILAVALVVFAAFSGLFSEISGPGGWGAKFAAEARKAALPDARIDPLTLVTKSTQANLQQILDTIDRTRGVALQLVAGPYATNPPYYNHDVVDLYVASLMQIDPALTIVFVDEKGRFVASCDAASLPLEVRLGVRIGQLEVAGGAVRAGPYLTMKHFIALFGSGDWLTLRKFVHLTRDPAQLDISNTAALAKMNAENVRSLVVVDSDGKPTGVLRRDRVVSRLMSALADAVS